MCEDATVEVRSDWWVEGGDIADCGVRIADFNPPNLLLNRVDQAAAPAAEAHTKSMDSSLAPALYGIAFYRDDRAGMAQQVADAAGITGDVDLLFALEADTAAYAGDDGRAQALADDLDKEFPEDTVVQLNYLPTLRARLALNHARPQQRSTVLRRRLPWKDADRDVPILIAAKAEYRSFISRVATRPDHSRSLTAPAS